MIARLLASLTLLCLSGIFTNSYAENTENRYKAKSISTTNGLPGNTIKAMAQDPYGFIWVGGTSGLTRYDGYRFVNFNGFGKNGYKSLTQHIGQLYIDKTNNLLWVGTSTYTHACFDIKQNKFVDYTGIGDTERPYRKIKHYGSDTWMFSNTSGIRHILFHNGKFSTTDYTADNHELNSNDIRELCEDNHHAVWAASTKGMVKISPQGKARTFESDIEFLGCISYQDKILAFSKKNQTAYIFNSKGKLINKCVLASVMGRIGAIKGSIVWRGKWIIFTNDDTFLLDINASMFEKDSKLQVPAGAQQGYIDGYQFVGNKSGNLWIFPPTGDFRILKMIPNLQTTNEKNGIFKIVRTKNGLFYIATYGGGLFTYNYASGEMQRFTAEDKNPIIHSNFLLEIMTDNTGCIWISAENAGLSRITPADNNAAYYMIDYKQKGDWTNYMKNIFMGKDGNVIVSTMCNNLYNFNQNTKTFTFKHKLKAGIYDCLIDSKGNEWLATRGDGIYLNGKKMILRADGEHVDANDFFSIEEDKFGRIWIGSWGYGIYLTRYSSTGILNTKNLLTGEFNENRIHDMKITPNGNLYIATFNGLYYANINKRNISNKDFYAYNVINGKFPVDEVNCIIPDHNNVVWAGTVGGGLVRCDFSKGPHKMTFKMISKTEGLSNNNVRSLVKDRFGYIWAGTDEGLSRIDTRDNYVRKYILTNNVQSNSFADNSVLRLSNGDLAFGTCYGLVVLNPANERNVKDNVFSSKVYITDIHVNGNSVYDGQDSTSDLNSTIDDKGHITLGHTQNSLTLYFSNFAYQDIESQLYQYYLEGLDNTWRRPTSDSHVEYSNLSPGKYVFHIKSLAKNVWSRETQLIIVIKQPWYNTWWAWIIYLSIIATAGYSFYRNAKERLKLSQKIQVEKELADFRINFFTHITHEFRTPLAIIQNAIDKLAQPGVPTRGNIQTAKRGTHRLLRLVNQFMEFRKIDTGNVKLSVEKDDIIVFIHDIYQDLWSVANQKGINYNFLPFKKSYDMLFDHQMVETMVYNLLSNAVKYTPENGNIQLRLRHDEYKEKLFIEVEDDGIGISPEQQTTLFEPFMHGYVSKGGMGIGLYTAHMMAQQHYGDLTYKSTSPKGGSLFTITLPTDEDIFQPEDYCADTAINTDYKDDERSIQLIKEMAPEALNNQKIVIIEDDPDMMEQIKGEIGIYFNTVGFCNGKAGYEGAIKEHPDLILCDIMLPDMNGYEIVKKLKEHNEFRHTPVIMLTALDDENHQIKGYQAGADDYMIKPCNFNLLIARMIQLIKWNAASGEVESTPAENNTVVADTPILTNKADKIFRQQVASIINQHIGDADFNVDRLAQIMCMGRTKFYGKMKEVYGVSPNRYLINERMEYAAKLILEGKYTISEISYKVGILDSSYFNKCFKARYGIVPSKYQG